MKANLQLFLFLLSITFSFFICSCKSDSPVAIGVNKDIAYNWSSQPFSFDTVSSIYNLGNDNLIINSRGIKKISGGVISPVTINDTSFNFQGFLPLTFDYYVFGGNKTSDSKTPQIKIYDNGTYRDYSLPRQSASTFSYAAFFIARDKFFISLYPKTNKYFLFDNGTLTEFNLSEGKLIDFFKANNNIYARAYSSPQYGIAYHRITESGPTYLWSESFPSMSYPFVNFLNNDAITVKTDSLKQIFSYFTETGWKHLFTYNAVSINEYISDICGESREKFLAFKTNLSSGAMYAFAWDGKNFTGQSNFPAGITQFPYPGYFAVSNYKDRTFYFYPNYNNRILYKAVFAGP